MSKPRGEITFYNETTGKLDSVKILPRRQQLKCDHRFVLRFYRISAWKYVCTKCGISTR